MQSQGCDPVSFKELVMKKFFGKVAGLAKDYGKGVLPYLKDNVLIIVFVACQVINSFILRCFTVKFEYNVVKPVLADIAVMLLLAMIGFAFKKLKGQFIYLFCVNLAFTTLCAGNSIYYRNFKSFTSVSLISTASQLGGVMNAITQNLLEAKDFLFLWTIPAMIVAYVLVRRRTRSYDPEEGGKHKRRRYALGTLTTSVLFMAVLSIFMNGTDYSRLSKQWNREYIVGTFGMYTYQISDLVSAGYSKLSIAFGYEEKKAAFNEFKNEVEQEGSEGKNDYTGILKGKNVIVIHGESIQQFMMDTSFNGVEVTPTLNRLAREGLYFSNFYAQESIGTSSDSEFTFSSSLMPATNGTVAINYWDRDYNTTQKMIKAQGYYVFSMHGNNGSYWNRLNLHSSLGYDRLYNYTDDFVIDETIGLGLSDKSFFRQAVPILKDIDATNERWYGAFLMLTNHTPFIDIERVSDFDVTFKYRMFNDSTGEYDLVTAPFLEGTKLGSYVKSVHYADEALGQFLDDLDKEGLLDNTVFILYGDHDAKLKYEEYDYYFNYNPFENRVLSEDEDGYVPVDDFYYNLNRKVPFIIWTKDGTIEPTEITEIMGMYDVQPTLGNMFGFSNKYAMGHDIFSVQPGEENVVVFPNQNFVTDTIYYDSQKDKYFYLTGYRNAATHVSCNQVYKDTPIPIYSYTDHGLFKFVENEEFSRSSCNKRINNGVVDQSYIDRYESYAEERISISNAIIYYDMIEKSEDGYNNNGMDVDVPYSPGVSVFDPPDETKRKLAPAV